MLELRILFFNIWKSLFITFSLEKQGFYCLPLLKYECMKSYTHNFRCQMGAFNMNVRHEKTLCVMNNVSLLCQIPLVGWQKLKLKLKVKTQSATHILSNKLNGLITYQYLVKYWKLNPMMSTLYNVQKLGHWNR